MKKKTERAKDFLAENDCLFRCPICYLELNVATNGLACPSNHHFELSKKGTLFFLKKAVKTEYDREMFIPRGRMIASGMYAPILEKIRQELDMDKTTLDVGCGEGSFLHELTKLGLNGIKLGFDISKDGIYEATNQPLYEDTFWCIADLTNLPFADESIDQILNIFTPSAYNEFERVLKPRGKLIKIIPEENYLKELRQAFYPNDNKKQEYSNEKVLQKLESQLKIRTNERVQYTFDIPEKNRVDLLEMSPLEWGVDKSVKEQLQKDPLKTITIDVRIIVGSFD